MKCFLTQYLDMHIFGVSFGLGGVMDWECCTVFEPENYQIPLPLHFTYRIQDHHMDSKQSVSLCEEMQIKHNTQRIAAIMTISM